jgi:hypothetical protein
MDHLNEAQQAKAGIPIFIDQVKFELPDADVIGTNLRGLVPVTENRDLWLEVPGPADDVLIHRDQTYHVKPGSHFYTAPSTINPGGK